MNDQVLAYERGIDDGFFTGVDHPPEDEQLRPAYKAGYDHGVWMFTTTQEEENRA